MSQLAKETSLKQLAQQNFLKNFAVLGELKIVAAKAIDQLANIEMYVQFVKEKKNRI